jgi:hypothetical protein
MISPFGHTATLAMTHVDCCINMCLLCADAEARPSAGVHEDAQVEHSLHAGPHDSRAAALP